MRAGLTPAQRAIFDTRYCDRNHRIDGLNYPTPDGQCPRCVWPDILAQQLLTVQDGFAEPATGHIAPHHPALLSPER